MTIIGVTIIGVGMTIIGVGMTIIGVGGQRLFVRASRNRHTEAGSSVTARYGAESGTWRMCGRGVTMK
jgi:hypothetical protein